MRRILRNNGEGKLGCILWLGVLLIFAFVAYKALPVKLHASELYDYMDDQARFAGRASSEVLAARILKRAKELDLPLKKKDLSVEKAGGRVRMRCTFTVPLEFPGYTYYWKFDLAVDRLIFIV